MMLPVMQSWVVWRMRVTSKWVGLSWVLSAWAVSSMLAGCGADDDYGPQKSGVSSQAGAPATAGSAGPLAGATGGSGIAGRPGAGAAGSATSPQAGTGATTNMPGTAGRSGLPGAGALAGRAGLAGRGGTGLAGGPAPAGGGAGVPVAAGGSGVAGAAGGMSGLAGASGAAAGSGASADGETGRLVGITAAHNKVRAMVQSGTPLPPLKWSPTIAAYAQEWADNLAKNNCSSPMHRSGQQLQQKGYGENLAAASGSRPPNTTGQWAVDGWAGEVACYTFGTVLGTEMCDMACYRALHSDGCGHYTQIVWRKSTELGCGVATCNAGGLTNDIWICNYAPAGNFVGQSPY